MRGFAGLRLRRWGVEGAPWVKGLGLLCLMGCLCLRAEGVCGEVRGLVAERPASLALLDRDPIHVEVTGEARVDFAEAVTRFMADSVLTDVQRTYSGMLPAGETPEFVIREVAPRSYRYTNRKKQESEILEVCKVHNTGDAFHVVYHARGERFFGEFEALIHVRAAEADNGLVRYRLSVYAYPENRLSRFVARNVGVVRRYFESKAAEVSVLAVEICCRLCG